MRIEREEHVVGSRVVSSRREVFVFSVCQTWFAVLPLALVPILVDPLYPLEEATMATSHGAARLSLR
jgi:hypothetical protein